MLSKRNGNKTSILIDFARMQCDRHSNLYPVVSLSVLDHFLVSCASTRNVSRWTKKQQKKIIFVFNSCAHKKRNQQINSTKSRRNVI